MRIEINGKEIGEEIEKLMGECYEDKKITLEDLKDNVIEKINARLNEGKSVDDYLINLLEVILENEI